MQPPPELDRPLLPSVFDRLTDPLNTPTMMQQGYRLTDMQEVVRRDLEILLNTRNAFLRLDSLISDETIRAQLLEIDATRKPQDRSPLLPFEEVERSVIAFGMPDLTTMKILSADQMEAMRLLILRVIATYEPRLRNVIVILKGDGQKSQGKLDFSISAELAVDPFPSVVFNSTMNLQTGDCRIAEGS